MSSSRRTRRRHGDGDRWTHGTGCPGLGPRWQRQYRAVTRRSPGEESGQDFWLVLPMYFTDRHIAEDGTEHRDCFVDSDGVIRLPCGRPCDESVTHWAELPPCRA